jgi:hypothetical protein
MLELKGTISQILPLQSGNSANGTWRKQEFILDIPGQYKKQVCLYAWGDNIDNFKLQEGEEVTASIDLESREYNGRWYTNVKVWKVARTESSAPPPTGDEVPWSSYSEQPANLSSDNDLDDLPF